MNEDKSLEVSWGTILRISIAIFCFYLIFLVRNILVLSVFGLVIAFLFETPIKFLEKRIPRVLAVVFLYLFVFYFFCLLFYLPASRFISEIRQFVNLFPDYFEKLAPPLKNLGIEAFKDIESFINALEKLVEVAKANIFSVLFSIFGGIASTVFVISVAIFLSLEGGLEKNLVLLFPKEEEDFILSLWQKCEKKVGLWFLASILSCLFVGLVSFFALFVLRAKYPLLLGAIAGALNFVPILGPIFTAFLVFIILSLESFQKAFLAVASLALIQQIENNIVTPYFTKKIIGLSPALVLISLVIGGKLFGILGAILTVPLIGIISEFSKGLLERKREAQNISEL